MPVPMFSGLGVAGDLRRMGKPMDQARKASPRVEWAQVPVFPERVTAGTHRVQGRGRAVSACPTRAIAVP